MFPHTQYGLGFGALVLWTLAVSTASMGAMHGVNATNATNASVWESLDEENRTLTAEDIAEPPENPSRIQRLQWKYLPWSERPTGEVTAADRKWADRLNPLYQGLLKWADGWSMWAYQNRGWLSVSAVESGMNTLMLAAVGGAGIWVWRDIRKVSR